MSKANFNVRRHKSYYADSSIPHSVTFIELESDNWVRINDKNRLKLMKMDIKIIEPIDSKDEVVIEDVMRRYRVLENYEKVYSVVSKFLTGKNLGSGDIVVWSVLDIVRLGNPERIYYAVNLIKDNKVLFSLTAQNVEVDGDKFPSVEIPFNLMIGSPVNFMLNENKVLVGELIKGITNAFVETDYFNNVLSGVKDDYRRAIVHFITSVLPSIVSEYLNGGKLKYKKRKADTIVSIQRPVMIGLNDFAVIISNMRGTAMLPKIINGKIKLLPRELDTEVSELSLSIIPMSEMYMDFVKTLKVVSRSINRR